MMQYLAWYANFKRNFKSGKPSQTTNQKQQKPQKTQQQSLLLALPMLWLSVATLCLMFVCWLLLWVRLPILNKQDLSKQDLSKQDNEAQRFSAIHAPLPAANPFQYPKAHSRLEMPEQSALQTPNKTLTQTRTALSNTTPLPAKWGITIHKAEGVQYTNQAFNSNSTPLEEKGDCVDVEICEIGNTRDNSDVVLLDADE